MDFTTPMPANGLPMLRGRVSLVAGEIVGGVEPVIFQHQPIPGDFGHDRGRGDGGVQGIALFNGPLGDKEGKRVDAVDQEEIGAGIQLQDCLLHGLDSGL